MKIYKYSFNHGKFIKVNATDLDENRFRFNSGYHDGASDNKNHWTRIDKATVYNIRDIHFDTVYALGYVYGWNDYSLNNYKGNSDMAWLTACANNETHEGITEYNIRHWGKLVNQKSIETMNKVMDFVIDVINKK